LKNRCIKKSERLLRSNTSLAGTALHDFVAAKAVKTFGNLSPFWTGD
jgi:hypothetical protein